MPPRCTPPYSTRSMGWYPRIDEQEWWILPPFMQHSSLELELSPRFLAWCPRKKPCLNEPYDVLISITTTVTIQRVFKVLFFFIFDVCDSLLCICNVWRWIDRIRLSFDYPWKLFGLWVRRFTMMRCEGGCRWVRMWRHTRREILVEHGPDSTLTTCSDWTHAFLNVFLRLRST